MCDAGAQYVRNGIPGGYLPAVSGTGMEKQGLGFARELEMPIYYHEVEVGSRRVDFLVEDSVMVELKAVVQLEDVHLAQGLNYLRVYNLEKGLLLNFGSTRLEVKRLFRK